MRALLLSCLLLLSLSCCCNAFTTSPISSRTRSKSPRGWRPASPSAPKAAAASDDAAGSSKATTSTTVKKKQQQRKVVKTKKKTAKRRRKKRRSDVPSPRSTSIWEHVWVPNGERRNKIKSLIVDMEREHVQRHSRVMNNNNNQQQQLEWDEVKQCLEDGMDILVQWAQLGEANRCETFANLLLKSCPSWMNQWLDYYELHVKLHRRVLHAQYNQLQRIAWSGPTKKPKFQLSNKEARLGRTVLQNADVTLQTMEQWSREYRKKSLATLQQDVMPLVDASDYSPLLYGYNQVGGRALQALHALRRLTDLYQSSGHLPRLAPSTSLYICVCKAISNHYDSQSIVDRMGLQPHEVVSQLCQECIGYARQFPESTSQQTNIVLYNVAFDAWSKALPPPSKQQKSTNTRDSSLLFLDKGHMEELNEVAINVSYFWQQLQQEEDIKPNAKTFTSMIYAYTKSNRLEDAFSIVEEHLMATLIPVTGDVVRVDSRALRMLANAMARKISTVNNKNKNNKNDDDDHDEQEEQKLRVKYAQRVEKIIDYLWDLTDVGYRDVSPDVYLYTTAVGAWASAQCPESALRAQMLVDDVTARQLPFLKPDIALYNALLRAIAQQPGLVSAADKAGSIVRNLVKTYQEDKTENKSLRPNVVTYNALIQACLASPDDIVKAEQTLERMILTGSPQPNERTFTSVIYALLEENLPARAEALLDRMEERYLPRASLYECLIQSYCQQPGMASRAQKLLERMELLFAAHHDDESLRPNRALYNSVITALEDEGSSNTDVDAVRNKRDSQYGSAIVHQKLRSNNQVFSLLKEVDANLAGATTTPTGNTYNFNQVLAQLANSGKIWSGLRAEDVLNYMLELVFKRQNRDATPDIVTFNTVMAAWAKSHHALAGERAAQVLKKLDDLHDMGLLEEVIADRVTYNTLMNAYAKSSSSSSDKSQADSGEKAQECFDELQELYEDTGDEQYMPDLVSYSTLLSAWARSRQAGAAKRAEEILKNMFAKHANDPEKHPKPTTACFNEVLYAWARTRKLNASKRAEMVLGLMENIAEQNSDLAPDTRTYNIVLLALANSPSKDSPVRAMQLLDDMKQMSDTSQQPDAVSYNTAISVYTKKGNVESALDLLEDLFQRKQVVLDGKFFASLINSLAETEAPKAPIVAERIVQDLLDKENKDVLTNVSPTTEICNALINCWGRSYRQEAPDNAEEVLFSMMDGKFSASAEPDVISFTSVIDIWAKSGDKNAPDRAEEILDKMTVDPNVQTYTAVIQAYARSDYRDKAARAQGLLQRMREDFASGNRDAEPSIYTYNAILNAAEYTVGRQEDLESAFKVACETFDEVRSSEELKPDHVTYGSFMGVIATLMPKSDLRNDMIQLVFRRCCVDGQVAGVVMKKFREAADADQIRQLMGKVADKKLPMDWTCNVRGARQ